MEKIIEFVTNLNDAKFIVLTTFVLIVLGVQLYLIFKSDNIRTNNDIFKDFLRDLEIAEIADNDYFSKPVWKVYCSIMNTPHMWNYHIYRNNIYRDHYITDGITSIGVLNKYNIIIFYGNNKDQINTNLTPFDHILIIKLAKLVKDGIKKGEVKLFKDIN